MDKKEAPAIILKEISVTQEALPVANIQLAERDGKPPQQNLASITQAVTINPPNVLPTLYSPASAILSSMGTRLRKPKSDPITGEASLTKGDLTIKMQGNYPLELKPSVIKLYILIHVLLTPQTDYRGTGGLNCKITLPVKDYMRYVGIEDTKSSSDKALRTIKEDSSLLMNLLMEYESKKGKPEHRYMKARVLTAVEYTPGNITLTVSEQFADYLRNGYITQLPLKLLGTDGRNPVILSLGMKLVNHQNIDANVTRGTADIIGVKSLIEACDNLPTYEEVQADNRSFKQRIIDPLEKNLDALEEMGILEYWEYCNAKKAPLTPEQVETYDYATLVKCYIKFKFTYLPDQTERIKANLEKKKRQRAIKKK